MDRFAFLFILFGLCGVSHADSAGWIPHERCEYAALKAAVATMQDSVSNIIILNVDTGNYGNGSVIIQLIDTNQATASHPSGAFLCEIPYKHFDGYGCALVPNAGTCTHL